jgi:hypothetical protein
LSQQVWITYLEESLFFLPNDEFVNSTVTIEFFVILKVAQSQKVFDVGFNVQKNVPDTVLSIFSLGG